MAKSDALTLTAGPDGGRKIPSDIGLTVRQSRAAKPPGGEEPIAVSGAKDRVRELHESAHAARRAENGEADMVADEAAPVEPRENVETIEVTMPAPDGRLFVFGPPDGVSLTTRISMMYAGQPISQGVELITRCCMSVRSIDGKAVQPIANRVDVAKVANLIGDNGLDVLGYMLQKYWPPVVLAELPAVKKNLRGS
jgi:hypothetical protein